MANVIKTVITYPLNGSTRDFNIPFEYLARKFIQVTLIGRDRKPLTNIDDYRFTSKNQITTNRAWGTGDGYQLIELRRFTSATERLVDFSDGSILRAYDLNVSQIQTLHVAEEARDLTADTIGVNNDGDLDARGRRIVNLADPVNDLDAVNLKSIKEWNNSAYQSYVKAKVEADKAVQSAAAAKVSQDGAESSRQAAEAAMRASKSSQDGAESSRQAAEEAMRSAQESQASAHSSAQEATSAKDYTKQQADRSYTEAERAKDYADSMGNAIDIGEVIEYIDTSSGQVAWKGNQKINNTSGSHSHVEITSPNKANKIGLWCPNTEKPYLGYKVGDNSWRYLYAPTYSGTIGTEEYVDKRITYDGTDVWKVSNLTVRTNYWEFDHGVIKSTWYNNGTTLKLGTYSNDGKGWVYYDLIRDGGGGVVATREWADNRFLKRTPSYRKLWSGDFGSGNRTITLSESIIGKEIVVRSQDRSRWEKIHIVWAGTWATGSGGSVNMFTVAPDGRTLTSNYENEYGNWNEIWILD